MTDILESLARRAGTLTFEELSEDRVLAAEEIRRLRAEVRILDASLREEAGSRKKPPAEVLVKLIRLPELIGLIGLSRSTIYKMMTDGTFPRPVRVSLQASAWRIVDVIAWQQGLPRAKGFWGLERAVTSGNKE